MVDEKDDTKAADLVTSLSAEDVNALNSSIMNRKISLVQAEKALAQNELAEMTYKYFIVQLYLKYGLKPTDNITESGLIVREGDKK